ncbi:SdrD B-like domain-containing protein [Ideonella sp. DXS22W]|uniref:SdrD B-like domain-containing protein n=1 Tax=Pseudaquabacterium inlustre TaxID=2984192 RepID=A0ABU9CF59_9BURK
MIEAIRKGGRAAQQRWVAAWRGLVMLAGALPTMALAADPQLSSFVDDDPVVAGARYTYTATVVNNDVDAATQVRLRVTVPAGASFVSAAPASANCVATTATQIDCNLGTVAALGADVRSIVLTWRALGPGPDTINATAVLTSDNDVNSGNNTLTQNTTVREGGDLSLAKTAAPEPVVGGANVTYTLTAANAGPNASGNLVITDNLPPSVSFVSASGSGWTCSHAAGVVTCNRAGPHAVGAAIPPVTLIGTVNAAGGTVTNTATVAPASAGGTADPDNSNNTATADTTVTPGADLRVTKSVTSGTPASAESDVSFRLQPRNAGPATAVNAVVTDTLPAGWTFVSATATGWSCTAAGQVIRCTRASLPTTATDDITVVATAPSNAAVGSGASYTNTATVGADTADPAPGNNTGTASINVLPQSADLGLSKSKTPNPVALGSNLSTTITVRNNGPLRATGPLRVIDRLGSETYVGLGAGSTGWSCVPSGQDVVCDHANSGGLAVNASLPTLTLITQATVAGSLGNVACTGTSVPAGSAASASPPVEGDLNSANDCASASATSTTVRPDLAITKTTSTPTGGDKSVSLSESSATFTLVVSNASATAEGATGVVIEDTLPSGLYISGRTTITAPVATVSGGSTAVFGCAVSGATVTCTQTGGVLARGETVTVPITVNRPFRDGSFTNTATVRNTAEGDPDASNNSASDTLSVAPIADVQMTGKTVLPAAVRAGENATYTLSYRNNGPSVAQDVRITDTMSFPAGDSGLTVVSIASSRSGSTCSIAAGAQLTPAAPAFTCDIGTLADGQTESVTLVVRPNFLAPNLARSFTNIAQITTSSTENPAGGDNGNNSQSATLAVNPAAIDLLVNKVDVPDLVIGGTGDPVPYTDNATFINYRVRVTSAGPSYGTNVRITERMTPPSTATVTFVCDTTVAGGATCNSPPLCSVSNVQSGTGTAIPAFTCDVPAGTATTGSGRGELASGQSKDIFLRFQVNQTPAPRGDVFSNQVTVSANEPETRTDNDTVTETTTTRQRIDLRVTKAASASPVQMRQPFNWVITVANRGPGNSLQTDLSDTLPVGSEATGPVTWTSSAPTATTTTGTCTVAGRAISCALGQLNADGTATITVPVRFTSFPTGGSASNSATVDTDPNKTGAMDVPGGNNTGTATVQVQQSSVSGTVFQDRDRSGSSGGVPQAAASEPRIAGVTLTLTGTDAYGNAVSQTTTTDASGNYSFSGLSPSDANGYTVTETQPAGYVNGPVAPPTSGALAPTAGGSYSAGTGGSGNSSYSAIVLPANTAATQYHFPELRQPSLSGFVYLDLNTNATRDAGSDTGISGATVRLLNASTGAVVATTTTDASGAYAFTGLDPLIAYTLEEPLPASPANLQRSGLNPGLIGGAACASGCTAQPDTPASGTDRIASIDLSAGVDGTLFNFGERVVPLTSISGLVYLDANRDNALGSGESTRIGGVTIRLVQGADCASGTVLQTTTSAADGSWRFDNVTVGQNYLVCETQPAGYGNGNANGTAGSNQISISNLVAGGSSGHLFGETLAAISGSVYQDTGAGTLAHHDNGVRNSGELGIAGVPVRLSGTDANGNAVNLSTTTDADGNFTFDGLAPSSAAGYTLTEGTIPASAGTFADGREAAGSAGGSTAVNDVISAIVLPAGTQATGYTFGELPLAPISGTVYIDRNRNGAADATPTDGRIAGVTLTLYAGTACSGTPLATTRSDSNGNFSFSGFAAGATYTVCETQPAGYADGGVNPGTNSASAVANAITITNLPATGSAGNLFGERVGSLAGGVYLDANHDGTRQSGETGIAGVTVTLTGTDAAGNAVNRSTTTDASGHWSFTDLLAAGPAGYTVTEQTAQPVVTVSGASVTTLNGRSTAGSAGGTATAPGTTPSVISAIALPAGTDATAYQFGEILPVAISGTVFLDLDNNGVQNLPGDTGIAGVTLRITGTDDTGAAVSRSVTTGADGSYSVADLRPGTYTVTEPTQPGGTSNGTTVPGSAGGTATAQATAPSAISGIVLTTPGGAATANNFGEIPSNSAITGRVWLDSDNNGTADAGETGIAGVTLTLTGTDTTGQAVTRSTTTDALGNYRFEALTPGTYTVTEPTQPTSTVDGQVRAGSTGGTATAKGSTPSVISAIALGVAQVSSANDFGEVLAGHIAGRVWGDSNDNGAIDSVESGIANVTLVLTGTDDLGRAVNLTVTTAANGSYAFEGLRPGTYTVTEPTQPAGTLNGQTLAGSLGGTATAVGTTPSAISGIVLPPGGESVANNFAEIGQSPDLRVRKTHDEAIFTVGKAATWRISVRNVGELASSGPYTVTDQLPVGVTLATTPSGNGWVCTGAAGASQFSCSSSTVIGVGSTSADVITAVTTVGAAAAHASPVNNAVMVDGGGELEVRRPSAAERAAMAGNIAALPLCGSVPAYNACRDAAPVQLAASLSGTVWFDVGSSTRVLDAGDKRLPGWGVEVVDPASGQIVARGTTATDGSYQITELTPGIEYAVRFRDPVSQVVMGYPVNGETATGSSGAACPAGTRAAGVATSCVGSGNAQLSVVLAPGQELTQQSLPVDPSGVVYDAGTRTAVPGAVVTLAPSGSCPGWNPVTQIVGATLGGYTVSGNAISMTVGDNGLYQFLFGPLAPASCTFAITVTPPSGYAFPSQALPPLAGPLVPSGAAGTRFAVQPSAAPPTGSDTPYYLSIQTGSGGPDVVNNHIPIDPALPTGITLSKTGDKSVAEVGDSVRYTITVQVTSGPKPRQTTVVDRLPAGFTYIRGTATVDGVAIADPQGGLGPTLAFHLGAIGPSGQAVLKYRVRVGVGAQQGDGINRARAHACGLPAGCVDAGFNPVGGAVATNEGRHAVRVSGGVFATEACVLGKVFVDCNGNHVQDREELGVPGVRLMLSDGTTLISDSEGKYSVCGLPPRSAVIKVDPATLPRGSRLTTSSNRNLGDAGSLWLDLKTGELHRADFIEGSCSNTVLEQVKARRAQGEVRAPETEKQGGPALRFDSKAHGLNTQTSPQQGTDGANQLAPKPRTAAPGAEPMPQRTQTESNVPTPQLPMNRPPPDGRDASQAPDAANAANTAQAQANGGSNGTR